LQNINKAWFVEDASKITFLKERYLRTTDYWLRVTDHVLFNQKFSIFHYSTPLYM